MGEEIFFDKAAFGIHIFFPKAILNPTMAMANPNNSDRPGICIGRQKGKLNKIRLKGRPFLCNMFSNSFTEIDETLHLRCK